MPQRPKTITSTSCVPTAPRQARLRADRWRGTAASRGYGWRWQQARANYLAQHPLCAMCELEGRTQLATLVDHIVPVQGAEDPGFWNDSNWQPLCRPHHAQKTANDVKQGLTRQSNKDQGSSNAEPTHPARADD